MGFIAGNGPGHGDTSQLLAAVPCVCGVAGRAEQRNSIDSADSLVGRPDRITIAGGVAESPAGQHALIAPEAVGVT